MDKFNRMFQKSTENTTMCKLTKLYAANVLKTDVITSASGNLRLLNLERESQMMKIWGLELILGRVSQN